MHSVCAPGELFAFVVQLQCLVVAEKMGSSPELGSLHNGAQYLHFVVSLEWIFVERS